MAWFPHLVRRIAATVRQLGWIDGAWHACARLLQTIPGGRCALHRYQFVAQPVAPGSLCRGRGKAIAVTPCLAAEALPPGPERPLAVLLDRYRQGAQCLVAHVGQADDAAPVHGRLAVAAARRLPGRRGARALCAGAAAVVGPRRVGPS